MLSVTYSYTFSSYSFCSTGNPRIFLVHSSLNSRQCSITSAAGVCWKVKFRSISKQANLHPAMCWGAGTPHRLQKGENTEGFLAPCGAQVWTWRRRKEEKTVDVDLQPSCPCPQRRVLLLAPPVCRVSRSGPWDCSLRHFHPLPLSLLSLRVVT